jgi:hypothetical protein
MLFDLLLDAANTPHLLAAETLSMFRRLISASKRVHSPEAAGLFTVSICYLDVLEDS